MLFRSRQHLYWKFLSVKRGVTDAVRKRIDLCRANRVVREYWLECAAVCSPDQQRAGRSELQAEHTCGGVLVVTPYRFAQDCRRAGQKRTPTFRVTRTQQRTKQFGHSRFAALWATHPVSSHLR